ATKSLGRCARAVSYSGKYRAELSVTLVSVLEKPRYRAVGVRGVACIICMWILTTSSGCVTRHDSQPLTTPLATLRTKRRSGFHRVCKALYSVNFEAVDTICVATATPDARNRLLTPSRTHTQRAVCHKPRSVYMDATRASFCTRVFRVHTGSVTASATAVPTADATAWRSTSCICPIFTPCTCMHPAPPAPRFTGARLGVGGGRKMSATQKTKAVLVTMPHTVVVIDP